MNAHPPDSGPDALQGPSRDLVPRTGKGWRTRARLLAAAEEVFGRDGYTRASIVDITRAAGVGQGTFYLYFPGKEALFVELVRAMGHDMRRRLAEATTGAGTRAEKERAGFAAWFDYVGRHPHLYRIVRESEFVAHEEFADWYRRLGDGYVRGVEEAMERGEFRRLDPELVAYCLMALGDFLGMRLLLFEGAGRLPPGTVDTVMEVVLNGVLAGPRPPSPA